MFGQVEVEGCEILLLISGKGRVILNSNFEITTQCPAPHANVFNKYNNNNNNNNNNKTLFSTEFKTLTLIYIEAVQLYNKLENIKIKTTSACLLYI